MGNGKVAPAPLINVVSAATAAPAIASSANRILFMFAPCVGGLRPTAGGLAATDGVSVTRGRPLHVATGSRTQKRLPPRPLSTPTCPPSAWTRCLKLRHRNLARLPRFSPEQRHLRPRRDRSCGTPRPVPSRSDRDPPRAFPAAAS